jgi:type IV pilus assembly protein PilW
MRFFINRSINQRQGGLSLVELLVAIALGLLILLGVISVFSASRGNYQFQQSSSAVQESGRIALEVMSRDIRMTGFSGCGNINFIRHRTDALSAPALPLTQRFSNADALSGAHSAAPATPDTLTLVRASEALTTVAAGAQAAATTAPLADVGAIGTPAVGDRILFTDCASTEVATVAGVAGNVVTLSNPLVGIYGPASRVLRHESVIYSVAGGQLMRSINGGAAQALVENVQNLKFTYGVDNNGDRSVDEYIADPGAVVPARWGDVMAVNVNLTLNANEITETFGTTVTLRNRAP